MYLLDTNVLIRADAGFYPHERIPQLWEWLIEVGNSGQAKLSLEIYQEIEIGSGALADWISDKDTRAALLPLEKAAGETFGHKTSPKLIPDISYLSSIAALGHSPLIPTELTLKGNVANTVNENLKELDSSN
ncbi:MAG: DUF4411 family protein [Aestuariivita sp.]|nr:DUF4411 family protein [Aestuariivita sp.]MCY4202961.1 DUF4411 family protein [Aestuariivita sp.]MCY4287475.1 DUF4411 family protein [Aestuariivita sp.]MCY4347815.1 DUF4411 family protein [Aestuariivita sp.]